MRTNYCTGGNKTTQEYACQRNEGKQFEDLGLVSVGIEFYLLGIALMGRFGIDIVMLRSM